MKLIACTDCHAQYDVTSMPEGFVFECRCGSSLEATPPQGVDATVQRCSACGAVAREEDASCDYCGAAVAPLERRGGLICPECMARNLEDARFCLACGVGFAPQVAKHDVPELRCPCCEKWMAASEVGGLLVQECPKCKGLWAGGNVFDALVDRAATAARERALAGEAAAPRMDGGNPASTKVEYRRCPECDAYMGRQNFRKRSGVIIDLCHEHGTWLDANELERIAGFVLSGRADRAAAAEAGLAAERERQAARAAALRMQLAGIEDAGADRSPFGRRRSEFTVGGSILELLTSFFD